MKKCIAIIMVISIILSFFTFSIVSAEVRRNDFVSFGTYRGVDTLYKVMGLKDINNDGVKELFLVSAQSITYKVYSADNRANWKEATLRTWLNSDENTVTYEAGKAPSSVKNPYDQEPGFISDTNMSFAERNAIIPVTHNTTVDPNDLNGVKWCDGGIGGIGWNDKWPAAYDNATTPYDQAYYVKTTDQMFIMSYGDMKAFGITPEDMNVGATAMAKLESNGFDTSHYAWIRDSGGTPRMWYSYNNTSVSETTGTMGVRPAFFLDGRTQLSGIGTQTSPYKIIKPFILTSQSVKQNGTIIDEMQTGTVDIDATVASDSGGNNIKMIVALYKKYDGKEVLEDLAVVSKTLTSGENILSLSINITDSTSHYLKILYWNDKNEELWPPYILGTPIEVVENNLTPTDNKITLKASVSSEEITINGATPGGVDNYVDLVVKKEMADGSDVFAYFNQIKAVKNGTFSLTFKVEKLFDNAGRVDGWYNITATSAKMMASDPVRVGISGENFFETVISMINNGEKDAVKKVFSNDAEYSLEYNSLSGRGFYLEDVEGNSDLLNTVITSLINNKPQSGFAKDTIVLCFNAEVAKAKFAELTNSDDKFNLIENSKYSSVLNTKALIGRSYYSIIKSYDDKAKVFDGVTAENITTKLLENAILIAMSIAPNSSVICDIITSEKDAIGITFGSKYAQLSSTQLKELYDKLLVKGFTSFRMIKSAFDSAYDSVVETITAAPTSSRGGGSGNKSNTVISMPVVVAPVMPATTDSFADINNITWGKEAINALAKEGIITGTAVGTFEPLATVTREQFAKIAALAFNIHPTRKEISFVDVDINAWYYESVANLYSMGIANGISDVRFGVGESITRQDIAVIIYRIIKDKMTIENKVDIHFSDADEITDYATEAVNALCRAGIINGNSDGNFNPIGNATRQETAQLIYNARMMMLNSEVK